MTKYPDRADVIHGSGCRGYSMHVSPSLLPLLALGLVPFGIGLLLFVLTRLEASLPPDRPAV
jgi:hypothetical protein